MRRRPELRRPRVLAYGIATLLALGCAQGESATAALEPEALADLPELALFDHQGMPFDLSRLAGRWSLLTFGYSHCPDVCPAALAVAGRAIDAEEARAGEKDPALFFVSVDPARDDVTRLAAYIPYFGDRVVGVTGTPDEIARLESTFEVTHRLGTRGPRGDYPVSHSGLVFVVGPELRLWARIEPPLTRQGLLDSLAAARASERSLTTRKTRSPRSG